MSYLKKISGSLVILFLVGCFAFPALAEVNPSNPTPNQNPSNPAPNANPSNPTPNQNPSNPGAEGSDGGLVNPLNKINSLPELLNAIIDAVIELATILLVLALVYVGFLFVAAQGNDEKLKSARSALMWTVIGGLVLLSARIIESVITATVGSLK